MSPAVITRARLRGRASYTLRSSPRTRGPSLCDTACGPWVPACAGTNGLHFFPRLHAGQASSPLFFAARGRRRLTSPSAQGEGDGAPGGATSSFHALRRGRVWRDARAVRRSTQTSLRRLGLFGGFASPACAADTGPRSALPGTRAPRGLPGSPCPSPAGSLQSGPNAARSGPGASRVSACEAEPRGPHQPAWLAPLRPR